MQDVCFQTWSWAENFETRCMASRTKYDINRFNLAVRCYMCNTQFEFENGKPVGKHFDHDHLTGMFRGAACATFNMNMRLNRLAVPVYFHNYRGYDNHHIVHAFAGRKDWICEPIAQNMEKFMSMTCKLLVATVKNKKIYIKICFRDSLQILPEDLAALVNNVGEDKLIETLKMSNIYGISRELILAKGIFPYSFFDSFVKMTYDHLPAKEDFYDTLSDRDVSKADYERAQAAWQEFQCDNMGDYMLRYLEMDVRQLTDVFEQARCISHHDDGLDVAHYLTISQLSLSSALKMLNKPIGLCPTPEMYRLYEKSIRGGISFTNIHYVKTTDDVKIMYIDANNLYGGALRQLLPAGEFIEFYDADTIDWLNIDTEGDYGYTLEVDLLYPQEIHDATQWFPLAAENMDITHAMLTPQMREQHAKLNQVRGKDDKREMPTSRKLVGKCLDKKCYVIHFKLLKVFLEKGLKISKIHQCIRFKQEYVHRDYIDKQTRLRAAASTDFEKAYYKQKANSLFGKSMENVRDRIKVKLIGEPYRYVQYASKATFTGATVLAPELALIQHTSENVDLRSTIAIGATVLDLSKLIMYDLAYNKLPKYERQFGCTMQIIGCDTDSLFIALRDAQGVDLIQDVYAALIADELLDTSNYPKTHDLYSNKLNARLGCIKDEFKGETCEEVVLLAPKCYSFKFVGDKNKATAKGVGRAVKNTLTHKDHKDKFLHQTEMSCNVKRMQL